MSPFGHFLIGGGFALVAIAGLCVTGWVRGRVR